MRMKTTGLGAALLIAAAASPGLSAAQGAGDKLTPPKGDDWRSTLLVCAEGKRVTAVFTGPERLTVATPQGEIKLNRVKGDNVRYSNGASEFVVENGRAQFNSAKTGPHKDCKPG